MSSKLGQRTYSSFEEKRERRVRAEECLNVLKLLSLVSGIRLITDYQPCLNLLLLAVGLQLIIVTRVWRSNKKSVLLYCKHKLPEILRWHEQVFKLIARRLTHRSKVTQDYSPARTASLSSTTRLKMKRMYLEGVGVRGPSFPSRWRILVASTVCSQSSINSHRCAKPVSLLSGFSSMILIIQSTMALLYSKPPYKREKKYFWR